MNNILKVSSIFILIIILLFAIIILLLNLGKNSKNDINIKPFNIIELTDFQNITTNKYGFNSVRRVFLVEGFSIKNDLISKLDSVVCKLEVDNKAQSTNVCFYQESEYTNLLHLRNFPRDLDRESLKDVIVCYYWSYGKFERKNLYLSGGKGESIDIINEIDCF